MSGATEIINELFAEKSLLHVYRNSGSYSENRFDLCMRIATLAILCAASLILHHLHARSVSGSSEVDHELAEFGVYLCDHDFRLSRCRIHDIFNDDANGGVYRARPEEARHAWCQSIEIHLFQLS